MTEKIGTIKNPLTIIAIFAGIAEVSGTLVLPFIADENQLIFIYFLIIFPSILIVLFFVTLNFNNKALYAPSDFDDESNYIKIFKYDESKLETTQVSLSQEEILKMLNVNLEEFRQKNNYRFSKLEFEIKNLRTTPNNSEIEPFEDIEELPMNERVSVTNFKNVQDFRNLLSKKGYTSKIFGNLDKPEDFKSHKSIWLGYKVPFEIALDVIRIAKEFYPHLEYISLSREDEEPPEYIHHQIYVGGSTESAKDFGLKKLSSVDWESIQNVTNQTELLNLIQSLE